MDTVGVRVWKGKVERVFWLRDKLYDHLRGVWTERPLRRGDFDEFASDLAQTIRYYARRKIGPDVIRDSLHSLAGLRLGRERLYEVCWRMAGNLQLLSQGIRVPRWAGQLVGPEFCPAQIIRAQPSRSPATQDFGYLYRLKILGGSSCPLTTDRFWTIRQLDFYSYQVLGFSRYRGGREEPLFPRRDPTELVSLRLLILIEPQLCDEKPRFQKVTSTDSLNAYNRQQHRHRARLEDRYACPRGYEHECYRCPIGLTHCRAATHAVDYETRECKRCHNPEAVFDPQFPKRTICLTCYRDFILKKRED